MSLHLPGSSSVSPKWQYSVAILTKIKCSIAFTHTFITYYLHCLNLLPLRCFTYLNQGDWYLSRWIRPFNAQRQTRLFFCRGDNGKSVPAVLIYYTAYLRRLLRSLINTGCPYADHLPLIYRPNQPHQRNVEITWNLTSSVSTDYIKHFYCHHNFTLIY